MFEFVKIMLKVTGLVILSLIGIIVATFVAAAIVLLALMHFVGA